MPFFGLIAAPRIQEEPQGMMRRGWKLFLVGLGLVIMVIGLPIAILPYVHIVGLLIFAVGLVLVLRNSFSARRTFIHAQRRHPKVVFPIRRLIRREPEVMPVFWQQTLRLERLVAPRRFRFCGRLRRALMRRRRRPA